MVIMVYTGGGGGRYKEGDILFFGKLYGIDLVRMILKGYSGLICFFEWGGCLYRIEGCWEL